MKVLSSALLLVTLCGHAAAHPVEIDLSERALRFFELDAAATIPSKVEPPPFTMNLASCPTEYVTMTETGVEILIEVGSFTITPDAGRLHLRAELAAHGTGTAIFENQYLCFGSATCQNALDIRRGVVSAELAPRAPSHPDGPGIELVDLRVVIADEDIEMTFSDCAVGSVLNLALSAAHGWFASWFAERLEILFRDTLAPRLIDTLSSFASYEGTWGYGSWTSRLAAVDIDEAGLGLALDADFTTTLPRDSCVGSSEAAEPVTREGPHPAIDRDHDVTLHLNLGLLDDALHHLWHAGLMCVTPEVLNALGLDIDFQQAVALFPFLPPGTALTFRAVPGLPPRIAEHATGAEGVVAVLLPDFAVRVTARHADGSERHLDLHADLEASARIAVEPETGGIVLDVEGVEIDSFTYDDQLGLEAAGIDVDGALALVRNLLLPRLIEGLQRVPLTGRVVGLRDIYLLVRTLAHSASTLSIGADLFRSPVGDVTPPDTQLESAPTAAVSPSRALVVVSGQDGEVPEELLRFRVVVNGTVLGTSSLRRWFIGGAGESDLYRVEVAAVDLAGNVDPTPVIRDLVVDGIAPRFDALAPGTAIARDARVEVSWHATDDRSPPDRMTATIDVYRYAEAAGGTFRRTLVQTHEVTGGIGSTELELMESGAFQIVVRAADEAGNEAVWSANVSATLPGGCGCAVPGSPGGSGPSPSWALLLALLAAVRRPRPPQAGSHVRP